MVFDRYLLKNLLLATAFTALSLAAVIMLTQSLRFLELIINSGASGVSFFMLTMLAMPRFFEVILPIALMIAVLFIYNRLSADSEIAVMKSTGFSPMRLSRPALALASAVLVMVLAITTWLAPVALASMQTMRVTIKAQYSTMLLREGIFNEVGRDLTVYIHKRGGGGEMEGLLIHDTRGDKAMPVTIIAKRGVIVSDDDGQQVVVYEGSRQELNPENGVLSRLDFDRYSLDLPESGPVRQRWKEPDERTFWELINPDEKIKSDPKAAREFRIEAHRRIVGPFLALSFTVMALCCLLLGPSDRRGLAKKIVIASAGVVILQGLYLVAYNLAKDSAGGLALMYLLVFAPLLAGLYLLSAASEKARAALARKFGHWL